MNLNWKLFHQHDSDNLFDHTFIDIGLFYTDLQDELKMVPGEKFCEVI